ncbi:ribonuclease HII [Phormidium sp. FACHB-1136]|uniref:ribonuclease HII n=1 Tax=Phormidium sp. FACHB-1136 TaxID=2692848 RepID=UPI0016897E0D|nr:ribonuclease HII [Phormidium sp. FACHB-1136]MBD2424631.1 ribonuclease HII [Phormidium sp. FACHB-1136]
MSSSIAGGGQFTDCGRRTPPGEIQTLIAGVDEVGRGALFGPVVAAAVILSESAVAELQALGVTDSKRLSHPRRLHLIEPIQTRSIACAIGYASVHEIDRINILQASLLAMHRAVGRLSPAPTLCRIDGNQAIPQLGIPQQTVIKGDQTDTAIAAASILAKVWRDQLMVRLDRRYPGYGLAKHKGYGSAEHRRAIQTLGPTRQHRQSFRGCQLSLDI